uniref:Uncharacterized protein n=1 Tax=mine drainage metagenome TaxID=410659 RepID=E6QX23_9ZZZZ
MKSATDRMLTAIYCDDIRYEMGNKLSFMGCYQGELFVPAAPTMLAKLCIHVTAWTPIARPFKSLIFRVLIDEKTELARQVVPPEYFVELPDTPDKTATRITNSAMLVFSPFVIEKPIILRVMADTEEGEISGPRLLIKIVPEMAYVPG